MTDRKSPAAGSFDAFWAEVSSGGATETIRGIEVPVPNDMPLAFEMRIKDLEQSESEDDIRELVALLFGSDVLDAWRDAGMGATEFQTVLAWAIGRASGIDMTFTEAYETVTRAEAGAGKAPNRAARRSASKKPSAATGGRSARTSAASTASRRKTSPR